LDYTTGSMAFLNQEQKHQNSRWYQYNFSFFTGDNTFW